MVQQEVMQTQWPYRDAFANSANGSPTTRDDLNGIKSSYIRLLEDIEEAYDLIIQWTIPVLIKSFEKEECLICMEAFKPRDFLELPCGHVIHPGCWSKWKHMDASNSGGGKHKCPMCRSELSPDKGTTIDMIFARMMVMKAFKEDIVGCPVWRPPGKEIADFYDKITSLRSSFLAG